MQTPHVESEADQEFRTIRLDLIRDPAEPARETMDEDKFAELVTSIRAVGLIEPIIVKDCNSYFEVIAGHRRTKACRAAELQEVPCMIRRNSNVSNIAIMIHENAFREDMNPIEEARFYATALEQECGSDVDRLCEMLRRDRNFVEGRLLLLLGHDAVVAALEQGKIPIATARALNKLRNVGFLPQLLDSAMHQGATARQVAEWVRDADQLPQLEVSQGDASAAAANGTPGVNPHMPTCIFCQSQKHVHQMNMVWLHHTCSDMLDSLMNRQGTDPA